MSDPQEYLSEDFRFTADLLRKYRYGVAQDAALFRAVCDHNLPVILAALAHAETVAPQEEADEELDDGIPVISKHGDRETI